MLLSRPLDDILSSGTKVAILRLLCLRGGSWTGREVARQTGLSSSNTARALHDLTAALMVDAQPMGRAISYRLTDSEAPIVQRLRELFSEEQRRRRQAAEAIGRRVPGFVSLILFGSEARGTAQTTSDTDLLVVVERRSEELDAEIDGIVLEESLAQLLHSSWLIADLPEVARWRRRAASFWRSILNEGLVLAGKPLERLRQHGHMADAMASGSELPRRLRRWHMTGGMAVRPRPTPFSRRSRPMMRSACAWGARSPGTSRTPRPCVI